MRDCPLCDSAEASKERVLNHVDILRCVRCDFVYADISMEAVEAFNSSYDSDSASSYKAQKSVLDHLWFEKIADRFTRKMGPQRVLDVGCGDCHLLGIFKEKGWDCYGLDLSPWAKDAADAIQVNFANGKIEEECFGSMSFDLVVSTSTLEHVYQPYTYVKALMERLHAGGCLYMSGMPNYGSIAVRCNVSSFTSNMPPQHVNFFNNKSMNYLFNERLEESCQDLFVGTYGIPEVHGIYRWINKAKAKKQEVKQTDKPSAGQENLTVSEPYRQQEASFAAKAMVFLYYTMGKPFHLGDKLEVVVTK